MSEQDKSETRAEATRRRCAEYRKHLDNQSRQAPDAKDAKK